MARLEGPSGHFLDLGIVGYEFPSATERWDANWLVVRVFANDGRRPWNASGPVLTTWDLLELADWFDAIAEGRHGDGEWSGLEPELAFEAEGSGDKAVVRAILRYGFYRPPPGEAAAAGLDQQVSVVELRPGVAGLRDFAAALRAASEQFPPRQDTRT